MVGRPVDKNWATTRQKGYFNKTMANLALAFRWSLIAPLLGAWGLAVADPKLLKIAIAALVLAMAVFLYRGWRFKTPPGPLALCRSGPGP